MSYLRLRLEYSDLWHSMSARSNAADDIDKAAKQIIKHQDRYRAVAQLSNVPWFLIGILHQLESTGDFKKHLHNGDSLKARTKQKPRGRPATGSPPFKWEQSALDALNLKKLGKVTNWTVERIAYELERWNGLGYRLYHSHVLSPFLWSGTDYYSRGKYKSDGKFDPRLKSEQPGAMPVLKRLMELIPSIGNLSASEPPRRNPSGKDLPTMSNGHGHANEHEISKPVFGAITGAIAAATTAFATTPLPYQIIMVGMIALPLALYFAPTISRWIAMRRL